MTLSSVHLEFIIHSLGSTVYVHDFFFGAFREKKRKNIRIVLKCYDTVCLFVCLRFSYLPMRFFCQ